MGRAPRLLFPLLRQRRRWILCIVVLLQLHWRLLPVVILLLLLGIVLLLLLLLLRKGVLLVLGLQHCQMVRRLRRGRIASSTPRRQPWRQIRPFDGQPLVTVEGADNILRLIACPIGKDDDAQASIIDEVPGFKSGTLEFGLAAKITFTGGAPGGGTFGLRLIFPDALPEEACYCQSILYEMQTFLLGSWREYRVDDRRIVDMVVHSTASAKADTILLVTFMNARPNLWNALPVAFEIWGA